MLYNVTKILFGLRKVCRNEEDGKISYAEYNNNTNDTDRSTERFTVEMNTIVTSRSAHAATLGNEEEAFLR
jgi:hypothetical protein